MSIVEQNAERHQRGVQTIIVVADDVTGAADSAARCRHAGLAAVIDLAPGESTVPTAAQFVPGIAFALSTDSRFLTPEQAAEQVHTIVAPLAAIFQTEPLPPHIADAVPTTGSAGDAGGVQWYKKIDSTLRGNLGSEIEALLALITPLGVAPCALICPTFPAQARTLVGGYLCYAGLPPGAVHLPTLLAEQSTLPVAHIPLSAVRTGGDVLRETIRNARQDEAVLLAADAETEVDLQQLLAATAGVVPHALLCGSAGLVGVLAQQIAATDQAAAQRPAEQVPAVSHPVLVIVGSGSQMAHQQLAYLRTQTDVTVVAVDPTAVEDKPTALTDWEHQFVQHQGDVALHLPEPLPAIVLEGAVARQYATALATVAHALIRVIQPATLMLVGGDTAVATLRRLGIQQLRVRTELLPGMPLTDAETPDGRSYQIILKAGNHGDQATLAVLLGLVSGKRDG